MASIEDFVKRILRTNRKFTFLFTEDFFDIAGKGSVRTDRYREIRNAFKNVGHRKGMLAASHVAEGSVLFDVEVIILLQSGFHCAVTSFEELSSGPFGNDAILPGMGDDLVDAQKAKFLVESFLSEKRDTSSMSVLTMLAERRKRQLVLVVESPADLKRPSLEPIRNLRSQLGTVLIHPAKGPIVDCQVGKIFQEGNSSSLSSLLNMFCVNYS